MWRMEEEQDFRLSLDGSASDSTGHRSPFYRKSRTDPHLAWQARIWHPPRNVTSVSAQGVLRRHMPQRSYTEAIRPIQLRDGDATSSTFDLHLVDQVLVRFARELVQTC